MTRLTETEKREFFDACEDGVLEVVAATLKKCPEAVDFKNPDGWTPLALAVQWAKDETVAYLLERGADMNVAEPQGCTALQLCERLHYESIAGLFRAAARARERDAILLAETAAIGEFSSGLENDLSVPRQTLKLRK
jgi:ankyrin repeat protein